MSPNRACVKRISILENSWLPTRQIHSLTSETRELLSGESFDLIRPAHLSTTRPEQYRTPTAKSFRRHLPESFRQRRFSLKPQRAFAISSLVNRQLFCPVSILSLTSTQVLPNNDHGIAVDGSLSTTPIGSSCYRRRSDPAFGESRGNNQQAAVFREADDAFARA